MRINIPDLLEWIEPNSNYTVLQVGPQRKRKQSALASAALLPEINALEPLFFRLNINPGYYHIKREIMDEFLAHRPHPLTVMDGKYNTPSNTTLVAKKGSFKHASESFSEGALKYP